MTEARRREEWDRTAALMATVIGCLSGKPVRPDALNPFRQPGKPVTRADAWDILAGAVRSGNVKTHK